MNTSVSTRIGGVKAHLDRNVSGCFVCSGNKQETNLWYMVWVDVIEVHLTSSGSQEWNRTGVDHM